MPLTKTFPTKAITTAGGSITSDWWAAHNPLVVKVERKDFVISSSSGSGTVLTVTITGSLPAMSSGDYVYIKQGSFEGAFQLSANVSGGATTFTILDAFAGSLTAGYVNLLTTYSNYYIQAKYERYNFNTSAFESFGAITQYRHDTKGISYIDIAATLKNTVTMQEFASNHSSFVNRYDPYMSSRCKVYFREVYSSTPGAWDAGTDINLTCSAMQPQNPNGNNIAEYVIEASGTTPAKFISDFKVPTYWPALPFYLSFIYSADYKDTAGIVNRYKIENRAIDDANLYTDAIDNLQGYWLNQLCLKGTYSTDRIKVFLLATYAGGDQNVTEIKEVKIAPCLPSNPVYLKWVGTTAARNVWCFGTNQINGIDVKSGGLFEKFWEDISLQDSDSKFITKEATPEISMGHDGLDADEMRGIQTLLYSPQVWMLMNPSDWGTVNEIWQTVRVLPGKFKLGETKASQNGVELTIQLLGINIQSQ